MQFLPLAWRRSIRSVLAAGLMLFGSTANAADFAVTNTSDSGPGSLRQAIDNANAAGAGSHTINFTGAGASGIINLGSSLPAIANNVSINGPGAGNLTVNGGNSFQVFTVNSGAVAISNLGVNAGSAKGGNGGSTGGGGGGGGLGAGGGLFVSSAANVTITNVPFNGNKATGGNGGNGTFGSPGGAGGGLNGGGGGGAPGGGTGSFGGGGGGSSGSIAGGNGGFGGGGGGGGFGEGPSAAGGSGGGGLGGDGGSSDLSDGGGGGGAALGGAIFVTEGGSLIIDGTTVSGSALTPGAGGSGGTGGQPGKAFGEGIYLNAVNVTFQGNTIATVNDPVAGTGGIIKNGIGILNLNAANTYTAPTTIIGGTVNVNGSVISAVNVGSGGRLGGIGAVGPTTVDGAIGPGNSIGTLTINGNYVQNRGSAYEVEVNPDGRSDLIRVIGSATINGGNVRVFGEFGSYQRGQIFTILTATGGVSGLYDGSQWVNGYYNTSLIYHSNDIQLLINGTNFQSCAVTFNQKSFAQYLDNLNPAPGSDLATVYANLHALSCDQLLHALDQSSGVQTANLLTLERLRSLFLHTLLGDEISAALGLDFDPITTRGQMADDDFCEFPLCNMGRGWRRWGRFYGLEGAVDGDPNAAAFNYRFTGFQLGADRETWRGGRFGVTAGYTSAIVDSERVYGHASSQGLLTGAYLAQSCGRVYAFGAATYGYNNYSMTRGISFAGINRFATGDTEQHEFNALVEAGYNISAGPATIRPLVGLHYLYLNQEGFTERGAQSLNLVMSSQNEQALWGSVGVRAAMPFQRTTWTITPNVHARWLSDWMGEDRFVAGSLSGVGGSYLVQGASAGRNYLVAGGGVAIDRGRNVRLIGDYTYQTSGRQASHTGSGAIEVKW